MQPYIAKVSVCLFIINLRIQKSCTDQFSFLLLLAFLTRFAYVFLCCCFFSFSFFLWMLNGTTEIWRNHIIFLTHTHTQHALNIYGAEKIKIYIFVRWWREGEDGGGGGTFGKRLKPSHMFLSFFMLHKAIINKQMVGSGNGGVGSKGRVLYRDHLFYICSRVHKKQ